METAIAIANPSGQQVNVDLTMVGLDGQAARLTLDPGRHVAGFLRQLLPIAMPFRGVIAIRSSKPVAVTALQTGNDVAISSLPAVALATPGAN